MRQHYEPQQHTIFSTDCSRYQQWQSYLLFHQALRVHQPGNITRIVSGCTAEQAIHEKIWHTNYVQNSMSQYFHLHHTPHFSTIHSPLHSPGKEYKFFNKPFGLLHWFQHSDNMGIIHDQVARENDIIVVLDPDMVLIRPITYDMSQEDLVHQSKQRKVTHGNPYAQKYGLGSHWRTFNLTAIAGKQSPSLSVSLHDANSNYPVGPPIIATAKDLYKIVKKWTEFVPRVYDQYPHLLAEMYAYCIAAAHVKLPHTLVYSLMVSNTLVSASGEAWSFVDSLSDTYVCDENVNDAPHDNITYAMLDSNETGEDISVLKSANIINIRPRPGLIHLCQRYILGRSFYSKRKIPTDIFSCSQSLLKSPPINLSSLYDYRIPPGNTEEKQMIKNPQVKREAYMICYLTKVTNDAALFYKYRHCNVLNDMSEKSLAEKKEVNRNRTLDLWA